MPAKKDLDWELVLADWIEHNLESPWSYAECAQKWGLNVGSVRNRASKEGWTDKLKKYKRELATKAVAQMSNEYVFNEIEMRTRQVKYAQLALTKAIQRLQSLPVEKMTQTTMVELLRIGFTEERNAVLFQIDAPQEEEKKRVAAELGEEMLLELASRVLNARRVGKTNYEADPEADGE